MTTPNPEVAIRAAVIQSLPKHRPSIVGRGYGPRPPWTPWYSVVVAAGQRSASTATVYAENRQVASILGVSEEWVECMRHAFVAAMRSPTVPVTMYELQYRRSFPSHSWPHTASEEEREWLQRWYPPELVEALEAGVRLAEWLRTPAVYCYPKRGPVGIGAQGAGKEG